MIGSVEWRSRGRRVYSRTVRRIAGYEAVVVRKNIRNIYLRIKQPNNDCPVTHLEITAPPTASLAVLHHFVLSHGRWIRQTEERIDHAQEKGEDLSDKWTSDRVKEATKRLSARLAVLLPVWVSVVGREPTRISLRVMKTRWGSCTPATGRIRLNLELADMPDRLLEYVLVHELTHLWASGHGPLFQRHMDRYLPDWRERRREINKRILV